MLMLQRLLYLIVAAHLPEPSLIDQAQLLEKTQTTIYRSLANGLIFTAGALVQFLGIYKSIGIPNYFQEQPSLSS